MKFKKYYKIIILIILIDLLVIFAVPYFVKKNILKNPTTNNYKMLISFSYPVTENEDFDNKIKKMIDDETNIFKNEIYNDDKEYELKIGCETYKNGNLYSMLFEVNKTVNKDTRIYYYLYYYDIKNKKEIFYDDILIEQDKFFEEIINSVKKELSIDKNISSTDIIVLFDKNQIILKLEKEEVTDEIKFEYKEYNHFLKYKGSSINSSKDRDLRDIESLKNKKIMLFTFDDGPAGNTTIRLLDELRKRDVRVTFFVMGNRVGIYSDIIKREYKEGHTISNHTYTHSDLNLLTDNEVIYEIGNTNKLLEDLLGIKNKYFRPPYGHTNAHILNITNMSSVLWNVDSEDWRYRDANTVYEKIISTAKDGGILLIHDLYETSVDGALRAMDELLRQGYALISLEEAEQLGLINKNANYSFSGVK